MVEDLSDMNLRVEVVKQASAFPVVSNLLIGTIFIAVTYYFPKHSLALIIAGVLYSLMPVYLGVAYPVDALGSLFLGFIMGYGLMVILSKFDYFERFH